MKKHLQEEIERVKKLSPQEFVQEYRAVDYEILHKPNLSQADIEALNRKSKLLLAGATDLQLLALVNRDMKEYGLDLEPSASVHAIAHLWEQRAEAASEFGVAGVRTLTEEAAQEIALNIDRNARLHKRLEENSEEIKWLRSESNFPRA